MPVRIPIEMKSLFMAAILAMSLPACNQEPTADELLADQLLASAKQKLHNRLISEARPVLLSAIQLDTRLGRTEQIAEESELLAENYKAGARFDSAFFYYEQSYTHFRSVADKYAARRVRLATADLHRQLNEYEDALRLVSEIARISEVLGDIQGITELNWALILIYREMGREEEEEAALGSLLQTAFEAGSLPMQARVYTEWGDAFAHREDWAAASENYVRALTIAGQAADALQEVSIRSRLAHTYARLGSRDEAFRTLTDGLVQSDKTPGAEQIRELMLVRTGNVYLAARDYISADRFYEAALHSAARRNDRLLEGYLYLQRGHCAVGLNPRAPSSLQSYEVALDLFISYSYDPGISYAKASLGISELQSRRLAEALGHLSDAVNLDSHPGEVSGVADLVRECEDAFYSLHGITLPEAYLEVLLLLGEYDEAFQRSEKTRAENIAAVLGGLHVEADRQQTTATVWEVQHHSARATGALRQQRILLSEGAGDQFLLHEARASRSKYRESQSKAIARFEETDRGVELLVSRVAPGVAQIQQHLDASEALITYIPTRRTTFVFAIRNDRWTVELAPVDRVVFENEVAELVSLLQANPDEGAAIGANAARIHSLGSGLYSRLIRPVSGLLGGVETLLVLPYDRPVPIHALPVPGRERRYMIQQYHVSYLPVASALMFMESTDVPAGIDIVGLGHAGASTWDVEYELRDIQAFHKPARLYFGTDASMATLRREKSVILHLAAEFVYDPEWAGNAVVRLSNGKTATGYTGFHWGSFFSLPSFHAVLVSDLSSSGEIVPAKPLLFLAAGSRSVILTSAPVRRKTKKMFGELFYTAAVEGANPAAAYRSAVTGLIGDEEYRSPEIWAPFTLWGD